MSFGSHLPFWVAQPALLLGITVLIGTSCALFSPFPWNYLLPFAWSVYLIALRKFPHILLLFASALYAITLYSESPHGNVGYFSIQSVQPHQSPFQKGLLYKGTLHIDHHQIPCSILSHTHTKANCDYIVKGKLIERDHHNYLFKAKEWIPVEKTWSLAELRYQTKERLRAFLNKKFHRERTASFLGSLLTGDVEERSLRYEFGRLGLQHILAISGFHFAILIAFCSFFLNFFLPHRTKYIILIGCISLYFLFVGSFPAVQRSSLMAMLYLLGKLIGRHASGLNLLGVALLIELILDPLVSTHLGFQLSFLSCIGILLFRPLFAPPLQYFLPKRPLSELSPFSQHIYLVSSFLRQGLAINFSVNLAILPLLLHHFHQFPLLALLYNLFIPLLVSIALFGLLLSLLIFLTFPPLADLFFTAVDTFTAQILDLVAYPPLLLDYALITEFPWWLIPIYLFGLFCYALKIEPSAQVQAMEAKT